MGHVIRENQPIIAPGLLLSSAYGKSWVLKIANPKKQGSLGYSIFAAGVVLYKNSGQPSMRQSSCHMERLRFHL